MNFEGKFMGRKLRAVLIFAGKRNGIRAPFLFLYSFQVLSMEIAGS